MLGIYAAVVQALTCVTKIKAIADIQPTDRLKEDLGLDSMTSLTFLLKLEEMIAGFKVDPDSLDNVALATVQSITEYVTQHRACQEAA